MKSDVAQLEYIHTTMRKLLVWLEDMTGLEFTETSRYRIGDNGVHGQLPVRGVDLRCKMPVIGEGVCSLINEFWQYDPTRPLLRCAIYHDAGSGKHIHLQVHDNTVFKGE